jgi:hypothetical protein
VTIGGLGTIQLRKDLQAPPLCQAGGAAPAPTRAQVGEEEEVLVLVVFDDEDGWWW